MSENDTTALAAHIAVSWLENPSTQTDGEGIVSFLGAAKAALDKAAIGREPVGEPKPEPAVTVRKSLASSEHILSMFDGKPYKALRRHLSARGHTAESYRDLFELPTNYPMVSKDYSAARRDKAKTLGLGRKGASASQPQPEREPEPKAAEGSAPEVPGAPRRPRSRQTPTVDQS